jgi:hypothetical protein
LPALTIFASAIWFSDLVAGRGLVAELAASPDAVDTL